MKNCNHGSDPGVKLGPSVVERVLIVVQLGLLVILFLTASLALKGG